MLEIVIANLGKVILTSLAALGVGVITIKKYYPQYDIFKVEYIPLYRRGNLLSKKTDTSRTNDTALTVYRPEGDIQTSEVPFQFHPSFHFPEYTKAQWQKYQQPDRPWIPITTQTQNHPVAIYRPQPYTFTCLVWLLPGGLLLGVLTAITLKWVGNIRKRSRKRNQQKVKTIVIPSNKVDSPLSDNSDVPSEQEADLQPTSFLLADVDIPSDQRGDVPSDDKAKDRISTVILGGSVRTDQPPDVTSGNEAKDEISAGVLGGSVQSDQPADDPSVDEAKDEISVAVLRGSVQSDQPADVPSCDGAKDEISAAVLGGTVPSDQPHDVPSGDEAKDEHANVVLGGSVPSDKQADIRSGDGAKDEISAAVLGDSTQSDLPAEVLSVDEAKDEISTVVLGDSAPSDLPADVLSVDGAKDEISTFVLGDSAPSHLQADVPSCDRAKDEISAAVLGGTVPSDQPHDVPSGDEAKDEHANVVLGDSTECDLLADVRSVNLAKDEISTVVLGGSAPSDLPPEVRTDDGAKDEISTVVLGGSAPSDLPPEVRNDDGAKDEISTVVLVDSTPSDQPAEFPSDDGGKDEISTVVLGDSAVSDLPADVLSVDGAKDEISTVVLGDSAVSDLPADVLSVDGAKDEISTEVLGDSAVSNLPADVLSVDGAKDEISTVVLGDNALSDQPADVRTDDEAKDEISTVVLGDSAPIDQPADVPSDDGAKNEISTVVLDDSAPSEQLADVPRVDGTKDEISTVFLGESAPSKQPGEVLSVDEVKDGISTVVLGDIAPSDQPDYLRSVDGAKDEISTVVLGERAPSDQPADVRSEEGAKDEISTVVLVDIAPIEQPACVPSDDGAKDEISTIVLGGSAPSEQPADVRSVDGAKSEISTSVIVHDLESQSDHSHFSTREVRDENTTHVVVEDVNMTHKTTNCESQQNDKSTIENVQCSNSSSKKKNKRKRRGRKEKTNIVKSCTVPSKESQRILDPKDRHIFHEHTRKNSLKKQNHEEKVKLPLENNKEATCRIKSCSDIDSHSIKQENAKKDMKSNIPSSNIFSAPIKAKVEKESGSKLKTCSSPKEQFVIIKESSGTMNDSKAPFVIRSETKDKITTASSAPLSSKNGEEKKSNLVFDNSTVYATNKNNCTRPKSSTTRVNSPEKESSTNLNEIGRSRNVKESTPIENRHSKKKKSKLLFSNSIGYGKHESDRAACNEDVPSAVKNTTTVKPTPCTKIQDTPRSNRRGRKQSEETSSSKSLLAGEFPKWGGNIGGYVFKNTCPIDNWMVIFHHLYRENRSVRERIQREDARFLKELEELYCQGQFNRVKLRIMEVNGIQHFRGLVNFFGNEWNYYLKHLQIFYQNTQVSICSSRYCPVKERRLQSSSCITCVNTETSLSEEIQSWFQPEKKANPCGQQFQTVPPRQAPVVVSCQNSSTSIKCDGKRTVSARRFKDGLPIVFMVDVEVYFLMKGNSKSLEEIPETIEINNTRYQLNAVTFLKENEVASHYICIFRSCNNWYLYDGLVNGGKPTAFVLIPAQFRPTTCLYVKK